MQLIKDNYLRSYGSGATWTTEIDPPVSKVGTYYEESLKTIEFLHDNKIGRIHLMYSGGVDSQYLFCLFLKLGIDFVPVIIQLNSKNNEIYNWHDIRHAFEFCKSTGVQPVVFDIDFDTFVESGKIIEIANIAECSGYSLPAIMYAFSQIDGFVVSGNEPSLKYNNGSNSWNLEETQIIHSILTYCNKMKINGSPFTLSYSTEMMFSFLLDPTIQKLGNNGFPGKLGSNSSKSLVYNNGSGFKLPIYDFVTETRIKYTGYEIIKKSPIVKHPNMVIFDEFKKKWAGVHLIDYTSLIDLLGTKQ